VVERRRLSGGDSDEPTNLAASLQESILAALLVDEQWGGIIAGQVRERDFDDGLYREVAAKLLNYRKMYRRAPGLVHVDDLFGSSLSPNDKQGPRLRKFLGDLVSLTRGLNAEYIANRTQHFLKDQYVKTMLTDVMERWSQGDENRTDDIINIVSKGLRFEGLGTNTFSTGVQLNDTARTLTFLESTAHASLSLGIKELDRFGIGPTPKEMLLYLAPKGSGKSWFCVHVGRRGLMQRERILHISLEFDEMRIAGRYYQSLFASGWQEDVVQTVLLFDDKEQFKLRDWRIETRHPEINFADPAAEDALRQRVEEFNLGRLLIKQFPTGTLTLDLLRSYLDHLEVTARFVPTILIVDYPDLMKVDAANYRMSLGTIYEGLRGVCAERNMAGVFPTQSNRSSLNAKRTRGDMVAEDVRKLNIADNVLTYSQTAEEKMLGLARINVEFARNAPPFHESILISQAYGLGQYVVQSAPVSDTYWSLMQARTGQPGGGAADEE